MMNYIFSGDLTNGRKILSAAAVFGMTFIFCGVVLVKVQVWEQKQRIAIQMLSAEFTLQDIRNQRVVQNFL